MSRLLAHIPVSPHAPSLRRPNGLHKLVTKRDGMSELLGRYCPPELQELVDGRFWNHPFGKWSRVPWLNPFGVMRWTGMRLDARRNAVDELPWLVKALEANLETGDELYTGGVPPMSIELAGLDKYIEDGYRVWFDGTSAGSGTLIHRDIWKRHKAGQPVGAEANRISPSFAVPVIADASQWVRTAARDKTHWTLDNHPPGSAAWFARGVQDTGVLKACADAGLDFIINFDKTPRADWKRVVEIVRAA